MRGVLEQQHIFPLSSSTSAKKIWIVSSWTAILTSQSASLDIASDFSSKETLDAIPSFQGIQLRHQALYHHLLPTPMTLQFYCLGLMAIDMFFQLGNVQIHPLENSLSPPTMITEIPLQVVPLKDIASVVIKKPEAISTFVSNSER